MTCKGTGRHTEEGSEEDMVPIRKIQIRHELEWEQEREFGSVSQKSTMSGTLRKGGVCVEGWAYVYKYKRHWHTVYGLREGNMVVVERPAILLDHYTYHALGILAGQLQSIKSQCSEGTLYDILKRVSRVLMNSKHGSAKTLDIHTSTV